MKTWKYLATVGVVLCAHAAQAQTLVNNWTFAGGGLDPATYGGDFQPATLVPDSAASNGATIVPSGLTTGGLGSSGAGDYEGIYTFFSTNPAFTMGTSTILSGLDQITITFLAGGGSPSLLDYDASSLALNYNGSNPSVASGSFNKGTPITVPTPIGNLDLTPYTWTWSNLSALGATSGFSTSWDTQGNQHAFFTDIGLTQAVPEPSAVSLIVIAGTLIFLRRKRSILPAL